MEYSVEDLLARFKKGYISVLVEQEIRSLWEWGIDRIYDYDIRQAVKYYYLNEVPEQFFTAPSSAKGNFHPYWHNVGGGLVRHLTECCVGADRLLRSFGYADESDIPYPYARDIVLAATVVTDTQKNGSPWGERTVRNHGEIAADIWRAYANILGLSTESSAQIAHAIHWHYGRYTEVQEIEDEKELHELPGLTQVVHLLDTCSASFNNQLIYCPIDKIPSPENSDNIKSAVKSKFK